HWPEAIEDQRRPAGWARSGDDDAHCSCQRIVRIFHWPLRRASWKLFTPCANGFASVELWRDSYALQTCATSPYRSTRSDTGRSKNPRSLRYAVEPFANSSGVITLSPWMSRAPGANSSAKRSQSRPPGGPEITLYAARTVALTSASSGEEVGGGWVDAQAVR